MPYKDIKKRNLYRDNYYLKYPEKAKQYAHKYYIKRREKLKNLGLIKTKIPLSSEELEKIKKDRYIKQRISNKKNIIKKYFISINCPDLINTSWEEYRKYRKNRNKKIKPAKFPNKGWYLIKEEISKCMILCANCHIKLHNLSF